MNLLNVLQILKEDVSVEKIKNATSGKVSEVALNALESKMKETQRGKFYDNTAMSIIKFIQTIPESEHKKYVESHAGMIYSILNMLKKGNSSFDMNQTLADSIKGNDQEYWKNLYSQARQPKKEMSKAEKDYNTPGLRTARMKEVNDAYLIFPKTYYKQHNGYKEVDIERSAEDIRKISAEIAAKDTSDTQKKSPTWGDSGNSNSAKVNHWCVAASSADHFSRYKIGDRDANFVIIIKKLKNGAPDWNNRYLFASFDNGNFEFANKWDDHVQLLKTFESDSDTAKYLMKFMKGRTEKTPKNEFKKKLQAEIKKVKVDAYTKASDDISSNYTKIEEENIKKIYKFCKDHQKAKNETNYGESIKLFKELNDIKTGNALIEFLDKKIENYDYGPQYIIFSNNDKTRKIMLTRLSKTNIITHITAPNANDLRFEGSPAATVKTLKAILKDESRYHNNTADDFLQKYHGYKIDDQKIKLKHPSLQQIFNNEYNKSNSPRDTFYRAAMDKDINYIYNMFKIVNNAEKQRHDVIDLKTNKLIGYLEDPNFKIE